MYKALEIADYIIETHPDKITNLKLQKLLYFIQGKYLAKTGAPLFREDIYAWKYGPVVPEVYRTFSKYVANPIKQASRKVSIKLDSEDCIHEKMIIDSVLDEYLETDARELVSITHNQHPWKSTALDAIITKSKIQEFFCTL